jgi:carboxypeptidase Taq
MQKSDTPVPYQTLLSRSREIALLNTAASTLGWDQDTYMPVKAEPYRADHLAYLRTWSHRLATVPEIDDLLKACEDYGFPHESKEGANVREWRRDYNRRVKLPPQLVEDFERTSSLARAAWTVAREKSDFEIFREYLKKLVRLARDKAEYWGYDECMYDALLAEFEPGMRTAEVRQLFAELRPVIANISQSAIGNTSGLSRESLRGKYPISAQQAFNTKVAEAIGFNFEAGRVDMTAHPFSTSLGPQDCRLTTRYNELDFTVSLYALLHEAGHGLYEQGLPSEDYGTPTGEPASLGIHESQSRLWENKVGRTIEFWEYWLPIARSYFPDLQRFSPEMVAAALNHISPSFIRLEADEVTYDLHIILRFELELRLIEGDLSVDDIPAAWNEEFQKLFGMVVPDDAHGCLQDVHWSLGSFGYFPTYTLGNLNSAQLFAKACQNCGDVYAKISEGDYTPLLVWLRKNVHAYGRRFLPQDLMQVATGESTQTRYQIDYLWKKVSRFLAPAGATY